MALRRRLLHEAYSRLPGVDFWGSFAEEVAEALRFPPDPWVDAILSKARFGAWLGLQRQFPGLPEPFGRADVAPRLPGATVAVPAVGRARQLLLRRAEEIEAVVVGPRRATLAYVVWGAGHGGGYGISDDLAEIVGLPPEGGEILVLPRWVDPEDDVYEVVGQ